MKQNSRCELSTFIGDNILWVTVMIEDGVQEQCHTLSFGRIIKGKLRSLEIVICQCDGMTAGRRCSVEWSYRVKSKLLVPLLPISSGTGCKGLGGV